MKQELIERFIRYAKVNTQSDPESSTCPSTQGQWELARMLVEELKSIGMEDVTVDENGYVMATLPANTDKNVPVIGFLAHMDTAPEFTGANVNPQIIEQYDGGDIVLNKEQGIILSPNDFPELAGYKGHTLITTDGTTLLGADDKAGIAEIMTAMNYLIQHRRSSTAKCASPLPRMRKSAADRTNLTLPNSAPNLPIRSTAGRLANWNTKALTLPKRKSRSKAKTSIRAQRKEK